MKRWVPIFFFSLVILCAVVGLMTSECFSASDGLRESENVVGNNPGTKAITDEVNEAPVKGMVTMLDLGADKCIPCKMMAPIIEKLEKAYQGKAAIVFIDVWKDRSQAKKFNVRAIPTQIFFDKEGRETYRHVGFMSQEAIVSQLKKMGVN